MMVEMEALVISLFLCIISVASISPGSILYASETSQTWSSPNNTFSLKFLQVQPPTSPPSFMVGIVHIGGVPIIWTVGGGVSVDSRGSFQFHSTGTLQLVNGFGAIVWNSGTSHLGVSSAFLDEQGNLVLSNGTNVLWSSFDHPTDTIVAAQNFRVGMVLRSGLYSFSLVSLGNMMLKWNDSVVYWNKGSDSILNSLSNNNPYVVGSDELRVLKLDNDGNLRIYSSFRGSGSAEIRWVAIIDQCEVFEYCGTNGICRYKDSVPICECPSQDFEMIDPNNSRKGCRRRVKLEDCPGRMTVFQLDHVRFLSYPPLLYSEEFYIGISACRGNCLAAGDSCLAATSLSDGTGQCYIKTDFISGYWNPAIGSTSYIKVCEPQALTISPFQSRKGRYWRTHYWIVMVVFGTLVFIALQGGLWLWCRRNSQRFGGLYSEYNLLEYASNAPVQFSYKELQHLTSGFKDKVGVGKFGSVYKGILGNGTVVAVKKLEGFEPQEKQFRLEVATICSTHHMNLVRLVGFCCEGKHRLLVYEFMKNGTLDMCLFAAGSQTLLDWKCRFNIALGSAKGISYLHEECRNCIIHGDIKPENILLDENYKAKLSDIGLKRLMSPEDYMYKAMSNAKTKGYVAPELLSNLSSTSKSDVYSYGMVLLEIVSGRRGFDVSEETCNKELLVWAYQEFEKGNIRGIVDKRLPEHEVNLEQVRRVILTCLWCIQEHPEHRPTMGKVLQILEGITEAEMPPPPKSMNEETFNANMESLRSIVKDISTVTISAPTCSSASFSPLALEKNIE
ncbi:hypothetical protein VNO77_33961 [Canavalia gladiata]|uniref:Receptor-like serine/threonine-protein kinase n=1 Tax=Canavalia gladiata TaxID=3824 RepID=A0AAN9KCV4_CANGL